MPKNNESTKLAIYASSSNSSIMASAKVGKWTWLAHCRQLKETASSQQ
jgi:hypothetical protein